MSNTLKKFLAAVLIGSCLVAGGCGAKVGVGVNVGVPVGDHGYVSLGSNRWF